MGAAIRFLRDRITKLRHNVELEEAKRSLKEEIDRFLLEKIELADVVICDYGMSKINDGDVILTYARSQVVEQILIRAREEGKSFQVIVADGGPLHEGKELMKRLSAVGLDVTYVLVNAVPYVMKQVRREPSA